MINNTGGLFGKYIISKADGTPIDPTADYFVLRLDTDEAARAALEIYIHATDNSELAKDLWNKLDSYRCLSDKAEGGGDEY